MEELTLMMLHDKKVKDGSITVIILEDVEKARSKILTNSADLEKAWKFLINEFK